MQVQTPQEQEALVRCLLLFLHLSLVLHILVHLRYIKETFQSKYFNFFFPLRVVDYVIVSLACISFETLLHSVFHGSEEKLLLKLPVSRAGGRSFSLLLGCYEKGHCI